MMVEALIWTPRLSSWTFSESGRELVTIDGPNSMYLAVCKMSPVLSKDALLGLLLRFLLQSRERLFVMARNDSTFRLSLQLLQSLR